MKKFFDFVDNLFEDIELKKRNPQKIWYRSLMGECRQEFHSPIYHQRVNNNNFISPSIIHGEMTLLLSMTYSCMSLYIRWPRELFIPLFGEIDFFMGK